MSPFFRGHLKRHHEIRKPDGPVVPVLRKDFKFFVWTITRFSGGPVYLVLIAGAFNLRLFSFSIAASNELHHRLP